jgi:hypothetical protein
MDKVVDCTNINVGICSITWWWVGLMALIISLIVIGVVILKINDNRKNNKNTTSQDDHIKNDADYLLEAAKKRLRNLDKWWPLLYMWNCWLTGVSVVLSGIAPFGLGLLLYIPPDDADAKLINKILIVFTAIGFISQVWNVTQKNKERAMHLRLVASKLESSIVLYQSGIIDLKQFALAFEEASEQDAKEPTP